MQKLWLALFSALLGIAPAQAQNFTMPPPAGVTVGGFVVVPTCAAQSLAATQGFGTMDTTGALCVNATVSATATISGFPTIQSTGTPISVSTVSATGTLPSGTVVVASNVGATNGAYCKLGASATTSDQLIPPNSWFAFTVGVNTQLSCITSTSTTTVNMVGGSGIATGSGGGGGGGGGGSVTQGTSPWVVGQATGSNLHAVIDTGSTTAVTQATSSNLKAQVDPLTAASWGIGTSTQNSTVATNGQLALGQFNTTPTTITSTNMSPIQLDANGNLLVNVKAGGAGGGAVTAADGAIVNLGSLADTAWVSGNGTLTAILKNIANGVAGSIPAGSAIIGKVGIDQTTPGTTNGVSVTNANANGQATMANSSPVVLASNQSVADPCTFQAKTNLAINQNGTSSVQLVALSGATSIYICSLALMTNSTATTVAFTTGTGTACVTGNAAVIGSTTANIADSINLIAGAGLTYGNGAGTIAKGAASSELCMILGSNVFVSGNLTYVQQ
jgi:hypothetical protein